MPGSSPGMTRKALRLDPEVGPAGAGPARVVVVALQLAARHRLEREVDQVDDRQIVDRELLEILVEGDPGLGIELGRGRADDAVHLRIGVAELVRPEHARRYAALVEYGGRDRRIAAEHGRAGGGIEGV